MSYSGSFSEYLKSTGFFVDDVNPLSGMWCRVMREADANKLKLTPEFLELKFIEAVGNNSKMFFGEKVKPFLNFSSCYH